MSNDSIAGTLTVTELSGGRTTTAYLREYVSVTDMKIKIEILDILQFRLVVHIIKDSAQHSDVFLNISCVRK